MSERIFFPFEIKAKGRSGELGENMIAGHGSAFDNVDSYGDVVKKGAFKKTIRERVNKGKVKLMDSHGWNISRLLGSITFAEEDEKGLYFEGLFSEVQSAQDVRQKIMEGHVAELSIGYTTIKEHYGDLKKNENPNYRYLDEVKLYEISPVVFAANEDAEITAIKSAVPFFELPIADVKTSWDPISAEGRVREWAGADEKPNANYRKAFILYDSNDPLNFVAHKFQIADVVDGKLMIIPEAIKAVATDISAYHENRPELSIKHEMAVKEKIDFYSGKMGDWFTPSWDMKGYDLIVEIGKTVSPDQKKIIDACKGLIESDPEHKSEIIKALSDGAEPDHHDSLTNDDNQIDESVENTNRLLTRASLSLAENHLGVIN
jgi:HK97 family phage prohead protease